MEISHNIPIVIDNGSGLIKSGLAGREAPWTIFLSIVGRPSDQSSNKHEFYIGDEAKLKWKVLNITNPVQEGLIRNWNDMEKIWRHVFYLELVEPTSQPVLLTESALNSKFNREKMAEIMFEKFGVPDICIASQAALALYHAGRRTGLVLDLGDGGSRAVPIYNGSVISNAILRSSISGTDLTDYLMKSLIQRPQNINTTPNTYDVQSIKESSCYVAEDYEEACSDSSKSQDCLYTLPGGNVIIIRDEQFRCPEVLFRPSLIMRDDLSIDQLVYNSIEKCDAKIQNYLFSNIVVAGGSSRFSGITNRLNRNICKIATSPIKFHGVVPIMSKYASWNGGSQIASLPRGRDIWTSKSEFEEYGAEIVHRKCM